MREGGREITKQVQRTRAKWKEVCAVCSEHCSTQTNASRLVITDEGTSLQHTLTSQFAQDFVEDVTLVSVGVQGQEGVLAGHHQPLYLLHLTTHLIHREREREIYYGDSHTQQHSRVYTVHQWQHTHIGRLTYVHTCVCTKLNSSVRTYISAFTLFHNYIHSYKSVLYM